MVLSLFMDTMQNCFIKRGQAQSAELGPVASLWRTDKPNHSHIQAKPVRTLSSLEPHTQGRRQISHSGIARQMECHKEQESMDNTDTGMHL